MIRKLLTLSILAILLAGCSSRETAKSAVQADQAIEAIAVVVEENAVNISNSENDEKLREAARKILQLVQAAKISLQPVIAYLSNGERVQVDTTVQEAAKQTETFVAKANVQAGRAATEVESKLFWMNIVVAFLDPDNLEGWLVGASLALFGSGTAGLYIARLLRMYKMAVSDAVAFGKKAKDLDPKDEEAIEALKTTEAKTQQARGTKAIIDAAIVQLKTKKTS